jgi:glutamyl-tRNA reductase
MAEGHDCLVVGGGKVATRKVGLLLDAKADVTVISPDITPELRELAAGRKIKHVQREFAETDAENRFLVFAATDDKLVNRQVVRAAQQRKVLCSSADGNWIDGDFVTPATYRKDELTVSISTGGRSCRKSRLIKENLARHIELVESTDLIVIGTSHHQLAVEEREPFHIVGDSLDHAGQMISQVWGIHEFMILNTCNRVELIGVVSHSKAINSLLLRVMGFDGLKPKDYYIKRGAAAFDHVAVVMSGLLSQTPGENNIVGQIKNALDHAEKAGWAGGMMKEWVSSALHVSKAIRHRTGPLLSGMEIEDLCTEYLRSSAVKPGNTVMVVGTGSTGTGLVQNVLALYKNAGCLWCYHRNKPTVPERWKKRVNVRKFSDMPELLGKCGLVVCAASSHKPVISLEHASSFSRRRETLVIDLAIPRNVDHALPSSAKVRLVGLDELKQWRLRKLTDMKKIMELANLTLGQHKEYYDKIVSSFKSGNKNK